MKKSVAVLAGFIFLVFAFGSAQAATFTVTKTADTNDGVCDADCSLREAVRQVNTNIPGGVTHRIEFSALFDAPQTISVASGITINYNTRVEIIGRGNYSTTLTSAAGSNAGVLIINSAFARVYNLRFADAENFGFQVGAVSGNDGGDLIIEKCLFENNHSDGTVNVQAFSSVVVKDSTFRNNDGGAAFLQNYSQTITGSTFSGNLAANGAAALYLGGYGFATTSEVNNSTFSGNTSTSGSIIVHGFNAGLATFTNITVANNTGTDEAVYSTISQSITELSNSIVSLNTGGNINTGINQTAPNLIGGNPLLGALAFNGGPTETRALLTGSPALDVGTLTVGVPTDQRGVARPQGAGVDLGAFEKAPFNLLTVTKTADTDDGVCDSDCSLREAMSLAQPYPEINRIEFSTLFDNPQTIELSSPIFFAVEAEVNIIGRGSHNLTLTTSPVNHNGVFGFNFGTVKIFNIRFANNNGGAIHASASDSKNQIPLILDVERCVFENNFSALSAGAISADVVYGSVSIKDSTFRNNTAGDAGGAITILNDGWTITGSTFSGNQAPFGSAIFVQENFNSPGLLANSTFVNNHSPANSFGLDTSTIDNRGKMNLVNVTVADNTAANATAGSAAIYNDVNFNAQTNLRNSIVSQNSFGNVNSFVTQTAPNLIGGNPLLGALANNGGETETMALLAGSPAIDSGTAVAGIVTDQRGIARPQGAGFDLGAFEKVQINQPQFVTDGNLPSGVINVNYSQQIVVNGGTTPYDFSLFSGTLPNGIMLSPSGLLDGAPTQTGSFSFVIKVTDAAGGENQKQFSLNITEPLQFVTASDLPLATVGEIYSQQLVATGGTTPYNFLLVGSLPNGVTLSANGLIEGTPTAPGNALFSVRVTDAQNVQIEKQFNFRIRNSAPQFVTGSNLPAGAINQNYNQQIVVSGGNSPFVFSLFSGALPNGVNLTNGGLINGAPTEAGNFSFTVKVTDAEGLNNQRTFNLEVVIPPLQILTGSDLPRAVLNQLYSQPIQPTGGIAPYSFSFVSGALPNGVTFTTNGLIEGTPLETGNFSFRLGVSDSLGASVEKDFNLRIVNSPQITTSVDLPKGFINRAYSKQIDVIDGTAPMSFSLTGGVLPNGVTLSPGGLLGGMPTESGFFFPRITVTDSEGLSSVKEFRLFVNSLPQFLTDADLPTAIIGQSYRQKIEATGGFAPLTFSIVGSSTGAFSISPDGYLSGASNGAGRYFLVIRVQDQFGDFVEKTFNLYVAAVFTVTKTADTDDGACNNDCSLREAVSAAGQFVSSVIEFSSLFDTPQTIVLTAPLNMISLNVLIEIRGKGANKLTIDGGGSTNLFFMRTSNLKILRDLRIINGKNAIDSQGFNGDFTLKIEACVFENNSSTVNGGAISHQNGRLVIKNSTFRNNSAIERGGAVFVNLGLFPTNLSVESSTFAGNSAPIGSALSIDGFDLPARIANSTFSGNLSTDLPNNIICSGCLSTIIGESNADVYLTNATIVNNDVRDSNGSALRARGGARLQVQNSIIANNFGSLSTGVSPNMGIGAISLGYNLIGFGDQYTDGLPNANNDYVGLAGAPLDPLLAPLAFNGGETQTHALQTGSLAIDHGNAVGDFLLFDQRGVVRPQGFRLDIGAFESGAVFTSVTTPTGSNVNTALGAVSVTFSGVSQPGTTSAIAIDAASAGTLPGGFSFGAGLPAFQITTTAQYTPPLTICVQVSSINNQVVFNALSFFHGENGTLVDRTISRDFPTRTICAQTDSLSPFAIAQNLAPTAANVSISGKVSAENNALRNAFVTLTDASGQTRTTRTNSFGFYRFENIQAGQTVTLSVRSKQFQFAPRVVAVNEDLADVDFIASP